jgi:hypothetical protein
MDSSISVSQVRRVLFWLTATTGSLLLVMALAFAQTPSPDRTPDLILFSVDTALLGTAIATAFFRCPGSHQWRAGPIVLIALAMELLVAFYGVWSAATYGGALGKTHL